MPPSPGAVALITTSSPSSRNVLVSPPTSNGATLRTGDLLASGTISGTDPRSRGSFIELAWNGAEPLELADGSTRTFLEDGDEVVLRGIAGDGDRAVALGDVRGRVVEA